MMYESRRHLRNCPFLWILPIIIFDFLLSQSNERTVILTIIFLITIMQWLRNDAFYYFTNEVFIAKGIFRFHKIPLSHIKKIEVRRNFFLKKKKILNRYMITYNNKKIMATPLDMNGFLETFIEKTGIELS